MSTSFGTQETHWLTSRVAYRVCHCWPQILQVPAHGEAGFSPQLHHIRPLRFFRSAIDVLAENYRLRVAKEGGDLLELPEGLLLQGASLKELLEFLERPADARVPEAVSKTL
jgi:hypothetical protein